MFFNVLSVCLKAIYFFGKFLMDFLMEYYLSVLMTLVKAIFLLIKEIFFSLF